MHGVCVMPTLHNPTPLKKKLKLSTNKNAPNQCFFLFGEYSHCNGNQKTNPVPSVQRPFFQEKKSPKVAIFWGEKKVRTHHILIMRSWRSGCQPKQSRILKKIQLCWLTFSQICLIPLVDDHHQSHILDKIGKERKKPTLLLISKHFSCNLLPILSLPSNQVALLHTYIYVHNANRCSVSTCDERNRS